MVSTALGRATGIYCIMHSYRYLLHYAQLQVSTALRTATGIYCIMHSYRYLLRYAQLQVSTTLGTATCFGGYYWPSSDCTWNYRVAKQQIQHMWGFWVWGRGLCGTKISFVSVVGAWSGTASLVYSCLISSYF